MTNAKGSKELKAYQNGKKLSSKQSILAKCCDCMGNYADGKEDCKMTDCPLYPYMPYGSIWMGREKKIMSPQRLESMRQRIKQVRKRVTNAPSNED